MSSWRTLWELFRALNQIVSSLISFYVIVLYLRAIWTNRALVLNDRWPFAHIAFIVSRTNPSDNG